MKQTYTEQDAVTELNLAAQDFLRSKMELGKAKANHEITITKIIELIGVKTEGITTKKTNSFEIQTTGKLNRTIDNEILMLVISKLPSDIVSRLINYKPNLVLKEYRFLENNEPEMFAIIAKAITAKPAKTSVKVKLLEE